MATNDEEVTVWVGGLDSQVTTELLWELFIQVVLHTIHYTVYATVIYFMQYT